MASAVLERVDDGGLVRGAVAVAVDELRDDARRVIEERVIEGRRPRDDDAEGADDLRELVVLEVADRLRRERAGRRRLGFLGRHDLEGDRGGGGAER